MNLIKEITLNDIKSSMIYYVELSQITNRKVTKLKNLETYFTVVIDFLRYLRKNSGLTNTDFFVKLGAANKWPKEFNDMIFEVAEKMGLSSQKDSAPILEDEEYREINDDCDNYWEIHKDNDPFCGNVHKLLVSRLIIKLHLHIGIRCEKLCMIQTTDILNDCKTLQISGYKIPLTKSITKQLQYYLIMRKKIVDKIFCDTTQLFISIEGNSKFGSHTLGKNDMVNSIICWCCETRDSGSYLSLTKHAIIKMIQCDIRIDSIQRLTGQGPSLIKSCYDYLYETDAQKHKEKESVYRGISVICDASEV